MKKVTVQPSDDLMKALQEERTVRKTTNIPETITAVLRDYFKMPKIKIENKEASKTGKNWRRIRKNRFVHYFLFGLYGFILFVFAVNLVDIQYPVFNLVNFTYSYIHTPTDYKLMQTYPPSLTGVYFGNTAETIYFQLRIHANTLITENTLVTISGEASAGTSLSKNISEIDIGFYGADYAPEERTYFVVNSSGNAYELWAGFAGISLNPNVKTEDMLLFNTGTTYGGNGRTVMWSTAGDKPITLGIAWNNNYNLFNYTYLYSTVRVYSSSEIRANQIVNAEVVGVFGGLLFGALEVYPSIRGKNEE